MSVLIKGMEMPNNCGECQFCHTENFTQWCCPTGRKDVFYDAIPEWCPLEEPKTEMVDKSRIRHIRVGTERGCRMTKTEAIAELSVLHERLSNPKDCEDGCYSWEDGWYVEAIDMAIEALSAKSEQTIRHIENNTKESDLVYRPSAEAVQGYTEWLEKLIVDEETYEWICEDTPDPEWCEKNCNYSSIQVECLRHIYEMSKGGDVA